jgi:hypothetical protein
MDKPRQHPAGFLLGTKNVGAPFLTPGSAGLLKRLEKLAAAPLTSHSWFSPASAVQNRQILE